MAILQSQLSALSKEELIAMLEATQKAGQRKITCKVSEKGAVSVYGFGRWPVTLYASQMEKLLDNADMIRDFMKANASILARKD